MVPNHRGLFAVGGNSAKVVLERSLVNDEAAVGRFLKASAFS